MIDPTLKNIKRLFVLPFKNDILDPKKYSCDECYMPSKEIDGFNPLIDNKTILEHFVEKKQKAYEELVENSRNYGFARGNLSDILYRQKHQKLIGI